MKRLNNKLLCVILLLAAVLIGVVIGYLLQHNKSKVTEKTPAGSIQMQNTPQTQEVLNNNTESSNSTSTEAKQWGDGTYEVGKDIPTGVYVANGSNCYWQISRDSNGQQPIQNNFGNGQQIVTLTDAGTFFKVSNCPFTARQ